MNRANRAPDSNMAEASPQASSPRARISQVVRVRLRAQPLGSLHDAADDIGIRWLSEGKESRRTIHAAKAVRPHPQARSPPAPRERNGAGGSGKTPPGAALYAPGSPDAPRSSDLIGSVQVRGPASGLRTRGRGLAHAARGAGDPRVAFLAARRFPGGRSIVRPRRSVGSSRHERDAVTYPVPPSWPGFRFPGGAWRGGAGRGGAGRSEEHTSELQSPCNL